MSAPSGIRDQLQSTLGATYVIERELGGGGMSRVFVARESALGRDVVIKVLPPEMAAGVSIERFKREIQVAARLQQANIVPLLAAGDANGLPYYVMPYVRGESLRARLARDGELPIADAIGILKEVARALASAHEHGVVHRDIKPDNVLLSGGSAVVTDFGVAKALVASSGADGDREDLTDLGMALGTPAYMSPEQASADPHVDHRADIYAFGCMAYELLTGQTPFGGRTPAATLAAHVTERPDSVERRRSSAPPGLAALINRCLEKRPADRPQSAAELLHALDSLSTPSGGMQPTSHHVAADAGATGARSPRRPIMVAVTIVAILAIAGFAAMRLRGGASTSAIRSIVVLPFENTGGDTSTAYFADGMRDEIATALGKIPSLAVASRTSSYAFRGKPMTPRDIGRELGVDAVLEGTVRRAGDQLRISAQLTRASTNLGLWSDSYNRKMTDVFSVQEELARAIAANLGSAVGGVPAAGAVAGTGVSVAQSRGTQNQQAYDLYLRGRYLVNTRVALSRAIELFESAVRLDPKFAQAYAGAATAASFTPYYSGVRAPDALVRVRSFAGSALALDSTLAEPHTSMGFVLAQTFAWDEAERELKRAIALDTASAQALHLYGYMLNGTGRFKESVPLYERAVQLDPLSPVINQNAATAFSMNGRTEESFALARRLRDVDPAGSTADWIIGRAHEEQGELEKALPYLERSGKNSSGPRRDLVFVYAKLGRRHEADSLRAIMEEQATRGGRYTDVAMAYAALGDKAQALEWLARAIDRYDGGLLGAELPTRKEMDFMRQDPRFRKLMGRMGLAP